MSETSSKPWFSTNRDGQTVAADLNAYLDWLGETWRKPVELAVSTAYFNPGGFGLLADRLERLGGVRLLLGADPGRGQEAIRRLQRGATPESAERAGVRHALEGHRRDLELDRDLLGFTYEADAGARRLVEWLRSGGVEVRRYERGFLHGKAFIVITDNEGVLAGSSNFTHAGLARNLELNIAQYGAPAVPKVAEWFEQLWEEAEPFDLAAIYEARYEEHEPYLIYLRMLYERYGRELAEEGRAEDGIRLTTFQRDGVWRAKRILAERSGVVIADGVGLGKTFIAGELIHEAVRDRRQRVLLIAPAALRDGPWRVFLKNQALGIDCISFEQLSEDRQLNPEGGSSALTFAVNEYAMVVIDEAHAYRNPDTQRAAILRRLLQGSPPKQLVLLTATPVNNTLFDLYYLLSYFIRNDAAFADAGIPSLREHFARAAAEDPDDLTAEHLFDVLDAVAVRRTRHFVKRYYPRETIEVDGEPTPIQFPKPRVRSKTYDLESTLPGFFARLAHALECAEGDCAHEGEAASSPTLSLARYVPSRYLSGGSVAPFQLQLAGLLRSGLLKRFESSAHAFALTCERMASSHDDFLALLDQGLVATGDALAEWAAMDSDELDVSALARQGGVDRSTAYDAGALRALVEADRDLLRSFAAEARAVSPEVDEKLELVAGELAAIAAEAKEDAAGEADERDKRKVLIFSYYADTVEWVADFLRDAIAKRPELAAYRGRMAVVSGSSSDTTKVLQGFAPRSSQAPDPDAGDLYDLIVSTDVLAEGVNLQQARHIINYDLPWNPMRLVQRHGRIDRIGSPHSEVFIRCILPDRELDDLLGLEERLQTKLKTAAATIGLEGEVLPGSAVTEHSFTETREEIELLRAGDPTIFESGGETHAYSGEEYRQELRAGLEDSTTRSLIEALPWGAGSGLARPGAAPGYVFCARVADQPQPIFRWVDGESGAIAADTLACLAQAACDPDTTRSLPEEVQKGAYGAWEAARRDIFESWQHATDPANLQPRVPKPMRDAAELLRGNPPPELEQAELDRLCDAIEAPYGKRIESLIRAAVRSSESPVEQARAVVGTVGELGLEPAPAPEPLPVIEPDDVHLICWLAVVDGD